jgi:hydroxyethylthiazole kinase-like uncharacterized protein yjeF
MQKVLTAEQMREVDRLTTERYGIPSIILMENAAHAVARVITEKLGGSVKGKSILILCGPGNNGGDGAALGRILANSGSSVVVISVGERSSNGGDAALNFEIVNRITETPKGARAGWYAEQTGGSIEFLQCKDLQTWQSDVLGEKRSEADVLVDALFGTGLTRPLSGIYGEVANSIGWAYEDRLDKNPLIVAVDVPSGLDADMPLGIGPHARADVTVTFTAPKRANVLPETAGLGGELVVADIGSPAQLLDDLNVDLEECEAGDVEDWLKASEFTNSSYKNKRGHALIIAGSKNYTGAAVLCGDAGIRSGVGLVTIATPESSRDSIVARVSPEVMVRGISETAEGSAAEKAVDEVEQFLKNVDVVAVGSGLSSKEEETKTFVRRIVQERTTPVVIDADGLTALSPWTLYGNDVENHPVGEAPIPLLRKEGSLDLILTPHEGEFRKLLGLEKEEFDEVIKDRVAAVRNFATKYGVILMLKGERGLIGHPDGRVVVNPTGNSGLGKAGNGDTLTGIIAGFVGQAVQMKIDIFETVVAAVYVAGMAGDIAEKKFGKRVMTASDVRECLVDVFEELSK